MKILNFKKLSLVLITLIVSGCSVTSPEMEDMVGIGYKNGELNYLAIQKRLRELEEAISREDVESVQTLLGRYEKGLKSAPDSLLGRSLFKAVTKDNTEIVRLLLDAGAEVDILITPDLPPNTWLAIANGNSEILSLLLSAGANPNAHWYGYTLLGFAASRPNPRALKVLLEFGAEVDAIGEEHIGALWVASDTANVDNLHVLLEAGANVNATDQRGVTALMRAIFHEDIQTVRILIDAGVKTTLSGMAPPLAIAIQVGNPVIVQDLLNAGADPNEVAINGATPLMLANLQGRNDLVTLLLDAGAEK